MNAIVDAASTTTPDVTAVATLTKWYADHPSIRRLWAIEGPTALEILIALEPAYDSDETLPIWLANRRVWAKDLQRLVAREVQLRLVVLDDIGEFDVNPDAVLIAELSWRVFWER